jgi:hypothetical protein
MVMMFCQHLQEDGTDNSLEEALMLLKDSPVDVSAE